MILGDRLWMIHEMYEWKKAQDWIEFWEFLSKCVLNVATDPGLEEDSHKFGKEMQEWLDAVVEEYLTSEEE